MQHKSAAPPTGQRHIRSVRFLSTQTAQKVDEATRTIEFPFSSETPVDRWFGDEILSHDPNAADFTRLNDGAPLLFNHDFDDVIGVVESAQIGADRRGYCTVRFAKTARGDEMLGMVNDGILRNVSFAYRVDQYAPAADDADGDADCYTATSWMAYEISMVTVPADQTVGVGRAFDSNNAPKFKGNTKMDRNEDEANLSRSQRRRAASGAEDERLRIQSIRAICQKHGLDNGAEQRMIESGASIEDAQRVALERILSRGAEPIARPIGTGLDLSEYEAREFSIVKAVRAIVTNDWRDAGFERDCSRTVAQRLGKDTQGFYVPADVQQRGTWGNRAPYQVGTPAQGGNLVQTSLNAGAFIEALRPYAQVMNAGATLFPGLVGNVDISRRITTTGAYWVPESGGVTEAEATFDKVSFRPKTVGALSKMSRLSLMQTTPMIEQVTRSDMIQQIALAIDLAALSGPGTGNQPTGITNQSGVQSVIGGTNGAAISFDNLIAMETALAASNAPWDSRAYLLNAATIGSLKKLKSSTGQYLWTTDAPGQRSGTPPNFNGYTTLATNQLRSNLTKGTSTGVCSELVFGAWSELFIGEWGVLEILVNPYDSVGFTSGDVLIRALQTIDIQVRHGASFAVMSDALTP